VPRQDKGKAINVYVPHVHGHNLPSICQCHFEWASCAVLSDNVGTFHDKNLGCAGAAAMFSQNIAPANSSFCRRADKANALYEPMA
jgi:hypothetical protein